LRRGLRRYCPRCGIGRIFMGYLSVNARRGNCGLDLASFRSDDAPPYFTILVVAHVVAPLMLLLERSAHPAEWVHAVIFVPLTLGLTLALPPRIKGAVIGWQWAAAIRG
jgi:uncharacterized protein (DUF983 family)